MYARLLAPNGLTRSLEGLQGLPVALRGSDATSLKKCVRHASQGIDAAQHFMLMCRNSGDHFPEHPVLKELWR